MLHIIRLWNSMPQDVTYVKTLPRFKEGLGTYNSWYSWESYSVQPLKSFEREVMSMFHDLKDNTSKKNVEKSSWK